MLTVDFIGSHLEAFKQSFWLNGDDDLAESIETKVKRKGERGPPCQRPREAGEKAFGGTI